MRGQNYLAVKTQDDLGRSYDSIEFSLADNSGDPDYDVKDNQSALAFKALKSYTTISVRSNKEITIKLNATTNSVITVERGRPMTLDSLFEITNIFVTNASGDTAAIKILGRKEGE